MHDILTKHFSGYPDIVLSSALIAAAIVLVFIALSRANHWFKALALAYVVLP